MYVHIYVIIVIVKYANIYSTYDTIIIHYYYNRTTNQIMLTQDFSSQVSPLKATTEISISC